MFVLTAFLLGLLTLTCKVTLLGEPGFEPNFEKMVSKNTVSVEKFKLTPA